MYMTDFEFNNKLLSDFDCIPCCINKSAGVEELSIGTDITFNTIKNNHSSISYITSTSYDVVYTTTFEICKNPCNKSQEEIFMTYDEARTLIKWLSQREYRKFKPISDYGDMHNIHYYGSFNIKQIMINGGIAGLSLTFTANSPYGFGETIVNEFYASENESFYVYGDTDEYGVIYPKITLNIKQNSTQDVPFKMKNETTGTELVIANCVENETITIDGEYKIITTDNEEHQKTICDDFNYEYIDILVQDDSCENEYISTPCIVTFEYAPIRKVGVF